MDRVATQTSRRAPARQLSFIAEADPAAAAAALIADWARRLREALDATSPDAAPLAEQALRACRRAPEIVRLAVVAHLVAGDPARALVLLTRIGAQRGMVRSAILLRAIAFLELDQADRAGFLLVASEIGFEQAAEPVLAEIGVCQAWLRDRLRRIGRTAQDWLGPSRASRPAAGPAQARASTRAGTGANQGKTARTARPASATRSGAPAPAGPVSQAPRARGAPGKAPNPTAKARPSVPPAPATAPAPAAAAPDLPELPRLTAGFDLRIDLPDLPAPQPAADPAAARWFALRAELLRLGLVGGFDELLCLPLLRGVEAHWYQIETVRKVLKQYRGRVLLADEVGLGKTVEAGMVLKEYALRGMAGRILILTPASLVGQWREEMATKFGLDFATSHDPLLRADPAAFWAQPRVIASIATARRAEHAARLAEENFDAVVVDEAHHLRDQASASYQLVNRLKKRFLLLLSATPVQNSLLELYNLLTLLQPGIFKTAKEFRARYMITGKPREPANRDRLRDLMRGVMIRNTRALAALRLPRRHAATLRAEPDPAEAVAYRDLSDFARRAAGSQRLAAQHLLAAAGSSPAAAAAALERFAARHPGVAGAASLGARYGALGAGAKQAALLRLLAQNPAAKKMVFVQHRDSMAELASLLERQGTRYARFDGSLSGPAKDAAVEAFRTDSPVLLCGESGGEGRNLQFCNTLINFDIPWNPMAIEQRVGRIDRIGQTREVFVFNLVAAGTIEDRMLRILDEKINMFELVVGEVGAILGELEEQQDFSTLVLEAWLEADEPARDAAFTALERRLLDARQTYEGAKALDEALFGNELDAG